RWMMLTHCMALVGYDVYLVLFVNVVASPAIYTLSLHDALPIFTIVRTSWPSWCSSAKVAGAAAEVAEADLGRDVDVSRSPVHPRSEEHTSELQSQSNLVCRLLLEKKNKNCAAVVLPLVLFTHT